MDTISQLLYESSQLPLMIKESLEKSQNGSLSVAEAHMIAQLSEIGFPGVEGVTTLTSPPSVEEIQPFLNKSYQTTQSAQKVMSQILKIDDLINTLPHDFPSDNEFSDMINNLVQEYDESLSNLENAEKRCIKAQQDLHNIKTSLTYQYMPYVQLDGIKPYPQDLLHPPAPPNQDDVVEPTISCKPLYGDDIKILTDIVLSDLNLNDNIETIEQNSNEKPEQEKMSQDTPVSNTTIIDDDELEFETSDNIDENTVNNVYNTSIQDNNNQHQYDYNQNDNNDELQFENDDDDGLEFDME